MKLQQRINAVQTFFSLAVQVSGRPSESMELPDALLEIYNAFPATNVLSEASTKEICDAWEAKAPDEAQMVTATIRDLLLALLNPNANSLTENQATNTRRRIEERMDPENRTPKEPPHDTPANIKQLLTFWRQIVGEKGFKKSPQFNESQCRAAIKGRGVTGIISYFDSEMMETWYGTHRFEDQMSGAEFMNVRRDIFDFLELLRESKKAIEPLRGLEVYIDEIVKAKYPKQDAALLWLDETDSFGRPLPGSTWEDVYKFARKICRQENSSGTVHGLGTSKYTEQNNTRLVNALLGDSGHGSIIADETADPVLLVLANKNRRNEVAIPVKACLKNTETFPVNEGYNYYDDAVHQAISTLYAECKKAKTEPRLTAAQIYRQMTGRTEGEYVSPEAQKEVAESVNKMRLNVYVYADVTNEMIHLGKVTNPHGKTERERHRKVIDNFLLSAIHEDNLAAGPANVEGWTFLAAPILSEYARDTGQISAIKTDLSRICEVTNGKITTDKPLPYNKERIAVVNYLRHRIWQAKGQYQKYQDNLKRQKARITIERKKDPLYQPPAPPAPPHDNTILFDTLFFWTGITNKNTKTNIRNYVLQVLDYFTARGLIKGYTTRQKGKTIDAVILTMK